MGNAASADAQRLPLTEDILRVILEQIPREDLKSASLVNRDLAAVSRSFILRQFVLNLAHEDKCQRRLDTLRLSTSVSQYVKELSIVGDLAHKRWWQYLAEVEDGPVTMQVQALEELQQHIQNGIFKAGLKRVRWDAGLDMPVALIEAIQVAFPECSFVLEKYAGSALPPMPTLVSLTATVHCHGDPLLNFQPILRHATGLRTLQISAYNHTGCVVRGYTEAEFAALPKPFLTYDPSQPVCGGSGPMLQDLVLERFSWSVEGAISCLEQMSWSHLRKLELRRRDSVPLLQACVPVSSNMPFLEEFVYTTWYGSEETRADITQALQDFLSSTSGLQVLHVEGPHHPLVSTIVAHHGETLRSLVLHDHERRDEPQRTTLTLGGLRRLGEKCRSLHHLGIDVDADYTVSHTDSEVTLHQF
ncbi:uncharacterized protein B0H18DRAFT_361143 [Fomitopsis serialis]|uniref:uncharacterized protein n=1 Tax=Fomitopsis serialis TaxID=139415 RepID=UPI0020086C49|nr:uncharacterized protein B0H18DRAFT_361143 [Neoantrodia serialis]KAH9926064.1 hypothetical protein B0H18DRAFT_361143 [Neoantrodia serialis]